MPFCSQCGKELEEGSKFCNGCGKPVVSDESKKNSYIPTLKTECQPKTVNTNAELPKVEESIISTVGTCPSCGTPIGSFQAVCPSCGMEFRKKKTSSAVQEFASKLETLESGKKPDGALLGVVKTFGLGSSSKSKSELIEEQILSHIVNFPVPNTKEDVLEFMLLATSNFSKSVLYADGPSDCGAEDWDSFKEKQKRNDAWMIKIEQLYQKALLSFGNDDDFQKVKELYNKLQSEIETAKRSKEQKKEKETKHLIVITIIGTVLILMIVGLCFLLG